MDVLARLRQAIGGTTALSQETTRLGEGAKKADQAAKAQKSTGKDVRSNHHPSRTKRQSGRSPALAFRDNWLTIRVSLPVTQTDMCKGAHWILGAGPSPFYQRLIKQPFTME